MNLHGAHYEREGRSSCILPPTPLGPACLMAGMTKLPFGQRPLMLYNGEVSCQTLTGKISIVRLNTHTFQDDQELSEEEVCIFVWKPGLVSQCHTAMPETAITFLCCTFLSCKDRYFAVWSSSAKFSSYSAQDCVYDNFLVSIMDKWVSQDDNGVYVCWAVVFLKLLEWLSPSISIPLPSWRHLCRSALFSRGRSDRIRVIASKPSSFLGPYMKINIPFLDSP